MSGVRGSSFPRASGKARRPPLCGLFFLEATQAGARSMLRVHSPLRVPAQASRKRSGNETVLTGEHIVTTLPTSVHDHGSLDALQVRATGEMSGIRLRSVQPVADHSR